MDDLPTDYDAIIVGTGFIESVIAAALSRIGKRVLHLDSHEFYGDVWGSFSIEGFKYWMEDENGLQFSDESFDNLINKNENEKIMKIKQYAYVSNKSVNSILSEPLHIKTSDKSTENAEGISEDAVKDVEESFEFEREKVLKVSRRFNLDFCPKLLFSRGSLVQLLISSNIARYAEFKSVTRVLTWRDGQLELVPCSRADVFATKNVTVVQKRILVKILTLFANYTENLEEFKGFENKTFLEYLKHKKLPENLTHYILYAIAMGDNKTPCMDGVKNCKTFLESLGRYGNTPFIFPMYGSGELPQCFCRLCAVFGGIYCLQRGVEALIVKDNQCVGVISKKKRLNAKAVILSSAFEFKNKEAYESQSLEYLSRGIFITNRSVLPGDKESLTLLQFPPVPGVSDNSVTVIELGSGTGTCPEPYHVVHMTTKSTESPSLDLGHVVEALFVTSTSIKHEIENKNEKTNAKPEILWSALFSVANVKKRIKDSMVNNLKICSTVDSELDYESAVCEAKRIFQELCPEEEFLPRAPDPEEIVLDVEETENGNKETKAKPEELVNPTDNFEKEEQSQYEAGEETDKPPTFSSTKSN